MIVYSGTKSRFYSDVMDNDIVGTFACADIVIPNAEDEEFIGVAELLQRAS